MTSQESSRRESIITQLAGIDLHSLAAFRIGLSVVLLWDLGISMGNARAFYSNEGFLPLGSLHLFRESTWQWSVHALSGSSSWQVALIFLHMAAALCLLVGCRTQISTMICWALLCSLHVRNPVILHSGDLVIRLLFFWAMFLPLGARWSLDASRGRTSVFAPDGRVVTLGGVGILTQVCLIYWMGAIAKNGAEWRQDGTAIYYALSLDQFVTSAGRNLLHFPNLCRTLTFGTWWLEVLGPILAFVPFRTGVWRMLAVTLFWCLHIGLWICFRLGPFPLTMMVAWLLFLPPAFWVRAAAIFKAHPKVPANPASDGRQYHAWMRHPGVQCFSLLCLVYAVLWNLRGLHFNRWNRWFPQWVNPFGYVLEIQQYWPMFAPRPTTDDGWVVMEALLKDGSKVDLLHHGQPVSFEKPAELSAEFQDCKWQKAILNLWLPRYGDLRSLLGNHLAYEWNVSVMPGAVWKEWNVKRGM